MALSDLTIKSEHYGAVDLKKNATKYFSSAAGTSIAIHVLILLLILGWTWFHEEDDKKIPVIRVHTLAELAPPPSTSEQPQEAVQVAAAPPAADIAKPNFGVPIPVPDAVAPNAAMPDQNNLPVQGVPGGTGPVGVVGGTAQSGPVSIQTQVKEEPPKDEDPDFVSVDQEPVPVKKIDDFVRYPEIAHRAGIQGTVIVSGKVGIDGKVTKTRIDKSSGNDQLDKAAEEAMMQARFSPAVSGGKPVPVWYQAPITFKIK